MRFPQTLTRIAVSVIEIQLEQNYYLWNFLYNMYIEVLRHNLFFLNSYNVLEHFFIHEEENILLINLDAKKYDADVFQVIKFHGNFIGHIKWLDVVVSCQ